MNRFRFRIGIPRTPYAFGVFATLICTCAASEIHVWETTEITLRAENVCENPYTDVEVWVQLTGPGFDKKVPGFWDGGDLFRVRVVATQPGTWSWRSGADVDDPGLTGKSGSFEAVAWSEAEIAENPNRRGYIRVTANGRALEYADGTPFVLLADTHWAASTWRYPLKSVEPAPDYVAGPGIGFEETIHCLKENGLNSIAILSCHPNWAYDEYGRNLRDDAGVIIREAWSKPGDEDKAADMHDEDGNRPFFLPGKSQGKQDLCADFDRINPAYWQHFDRKMAYMQDQGLVPYVETIRRDAFPSWIAYYEFQESFPRFLRYFGARYGAYNFIYSLIHLDKIPPEWMNDGKFKQIFDALNQYYADCGPMPFGQPMTSMGHHSTYKIFGHIDQSPWQQMHTSGNQPRHNGVYEWVESLFKLEPPIPVFNNEPYYVGHNNPGVIGGKPAPPPGPHADYYGRAQLYGDILSGALAGHVYGSLSWPGITTGEPNHSNPQMAVHFWEPFEFDAFGQVQYAEKFLLSEGKDYQNLTLASDDIHPRKNPDCPENGLDGWAFMMRTPDERLAVLYFEEKCHQASLARMAPNAAYECLWFDPRTGEWQDAETLSTDEAGNLHLPPFPGGARFSEDDWALKLVRSDR